MSSPEKEPSNKLAFAGPGLVAWARVTALGHKTGHGSQHRAGGMSAGLGTGETRA